MDGTPRRERGDEKRTKPLGCLWLVFGPNAAPRRAAPRCPCKLQQPTDKFDLKLQTAPRSAIRRIASFILACRIFSLFFMGNAVMCKNTFVVI